MWTGTGLWPGSWVALLYRLLSGCKAEKWSALELVVVWVEAAKMYFLLLGLNWCSTRATTACGGANRLWWRWLHGPLCHRSRWLHSKSLLDLKVFWIWKILFLKPIWGWPPSKNLVFVMKSMVGKECSLVWGCKGTWMYLWQRHSLVKTVVLWNWAPLCLPKRLWGPPACWTVVLCWRGSPRTTWGFITHEISIRNTK